MAFLFILLTCLAVNMAGNASEPIKRTIHVNNDTQTLYGKHIFVMTKQGVLRVRDVINHKYKIDYIVHWHKSPGHHGVRYWCEMCKKAYKQRYGFIAHMNLFHGLLLKHNSNRWKWVPTSTYLAGEWQFVCDKCMKKFDSEKKFHEHLIKVHREMPYVYE